MFVTLRVSVAAFLCLLVMGCASSDLIQIPGRGDAILFESRPHGATVTLLQTGDSCVAPCALKVKKRLKELQVVMVP